MAQPNTDVPKTGSAGSKVTVACKLPHGLMLRAFKMIPDYEPVMGGGRRETSRAEEVARFPVLGVLRKTNEPARSLVNGFALTRNVPKDVWEAWLKDNKASAMVKNGLIFACESRDHVTGQTKENRDRVTGLEPFNLDGDPRKPASVLPVTAEQDQRQRRLEHADNDRDYSERDE